MLGFCVKVEGLWEVKAELCPGVELRLGVKLCRVLKVKLKTR